MKQVPGLTHLQLCIEAVPEFPAVLGEALAGVPHLEVLNLHIGWLQLGDVMVLVQQPQLPMENWRNTYYSAVAPGLAHLKKLRELHLHRDRDVVRSKENAYFDTGAACFLSGILHRYHRMCFDLQAYLHVQWLRFQHVSAYSLCETSGKMDTKDMPLPRNA